MSKKPTRRKRRQRRPAFWKYALGAVVTAGLAVLVFGGLRGGYDTFIRSTFTLDHYDTVMKACDDFGMQPSLVYGIMRNESGFDERAHSSADARARQIRFRCA